MYNVPYRTDLRIELLSTVINFIYMYIRTLRTLVPGIFPGVGSEGTHLTAQRLTFDLGKLSKFFLYGCLRLFKEQLAGGLLF